jgi:FtsP/CotA-like multicopper oxidase with cupredoxin domain
MKLVGGDSGRLEHETFVEEVLLAPSERAVIDVLFETAGSVPLEHRTPGHTYELGTIRVRDEPIEQSFSPQHHPFHVHGAGRFLVLTRDGNTETNLVWKDTVLVRAGETVDILLDVTNPGLWMAHCHIAEHNQAGMMFSFPVADREVS